MSNDSMIFLQQKGIIFCGVAMDSSILLGLMACLVAATVATGSDGHQDRLPP
jgi:hypothetical protein